MGLLTYFLLRILVRHEGLAEQVYGGFVYPVIRGAFGYTLSFLPFPAIYLVALILLVILYKTAIRPLLSRNWTWKSFVMGLLSTAGAVFSLFYILWGFNYARPGVIDRMELYAMPLDTSALIEEFDYATEELLSWSVKNEENIRTGIQGYTKGQESDLADFVRKVVTPLGYDNVSRPRGRRIFPKGILMRFSTAGIYIPFSGEGHVDAGMLPVQLPFTMAHELAHGFGVTNEGECNFVAYLACKDSDDPVIRYSGLLSYWRYIASEYRRRFPEEYKARYDGSTRADQGKHDCHSREQCKIPGYHACGARQGV